MLKSLFVSATLIFLSVSARAAGSLECYVEEVSGGDAWVQKFELASIDDPHGSIHMFNLQNFTSYTGMVALTKGFTIIHLYDETTGIATTAQSESEGKRYARLQVILKTESYNSTDAVIIECGVPNEALSQK